MYWYFKQVEYRSVPRTVRLKGFRNVAQYVSDSSEEEAVHIMRRTRVVLQKRLMKI